VKNTYVKFHKYFASSNNVNKVKTIKKNKIYSTQHYLLCFIHCHRQITSHMNIFM